MNRKTSLFLCAALVLLLSACGGKDRTVFTGKVYPPTQKIATVFQYTQVPRPCRVFAETLMTLPATSNGAEIQRLVFGEAAAKGADLVLIGQTREMEDDEGFGVIYFGPEKEYLCAESWCGWKFGYDEWEDQGDWVNIGLKEWGNASVTFAPPLMMQVAFLRCR